MLFRNIRFCLCGRPALRNSRECRTCYEDAVRREWREQFRLEASLGAPGPLRIVRPGARGLFAEPEEVLAAGANAQRATGLIPVVAALPAP